MSSYIYDPNKKPSQKKVDDLGKQPNGIEFVRIDSGDGFIDGLFKRELSSDALVVLFPAAMPMSLLESGQFPYIPRWQWVEEIPCNVWCFEEYLARKYNIAAAWFHDQEKFSAEVVAEIVMEIAKSLGVDNSRITLMGSSLGGFGALMVAPRIPGARVIADICQTDLLTYPIRSAIENFCEKIYKTRDVESVNSQFRDRFSVIERFRNLGYIPPMTIMHDISDEPNGHTQVYAFLSDLARIQKELEKTVQVEVLIRNSGKGHVALFKAAMMPILTRIAGI